MPLGLIMLKRKSIIHIRIASVGSVEKKDEMVNHISESSKQAQKEYKIRIDWVGKVIYWELCKK